MSATKVRPRKTRVAIVIPTHWDYRMGGSQYQAKLLIEELYQTHGADIAYMTARASDKTHFTDHRVVCVGKTNAIRRFGHFWDYFRLQKALQDFAPDVIYQRVGCAYTGISVRYAKRFDTPLIWHLASTNDCRKAPAVSQSLVRPHVLVESRLAKRAIDNADVVVAQSRDQIEMLYQNFGRQPIRLIRNFHRVPPAHEKPAGSFTVLWIANLKFIKRPELFLDIASLLQDLPEIEFLMIGQKYGSHSLQSRFEQAMHGHANVKFLGEMSQDDVNALLERSQLLVNTSETEGFSNTFIQAWMRSVPVLTNGVNPDGILDDGFLGRSHDSIDGIASSIRDLVTNTEMLVDMGERSRQYAVQHYSMENAAELADLVIKTAADKRINTTQIPEN